MSAAAAHGRRSGCALQRRDQHEAAGWCRAGEQSRAHRPSLSKVPRAGEPPPAFLGWFFVFFGGVFLLMGEALALCLFLSGRWLSKGRRYWFSFVVACIACTIMPFGTVLGVFTIIVLSRDSVKRRYGLLRPTL